jgi:hypothetical protein
VRATCLDGLESWGITVDAGRNAGTGAGAAAFAATPAAGPGDARDRSDEGRRGLLGPRGPRERSERHQFGTGARVISPDSGRVAVCVVPTNEEYAIAQDVLAVVNRGRPPGRP